MQAYWFNKTLYSALSVIAILLFSFSSTGSRGALALPLQAGAPLPTTLVRVTDTSNAAGGWNPSSPDPAGIDYWPLTGRLLVSDSEVEEMASYWAGKNVYAMTSSGTLVSTCTTFTGPSINFTYNNFSGEPSGLAINPNNNHLFFTDDNGMNDKVIEIGLGADGQYCTSDDTVTPTIVATAYGANDAEDVAYGNNTLFIADGVNAEVYVIPLGANGVLGGGDDGATFHFDTAIFGFHNVEGIGYNADSDTLFIVSALNSDKFLGEVTTGGTLLNTYSLAYSGLVHPEDVTYAPGSQNPAIKSIYITDRGLDNNSVPNENDGKVWEISLGIPWVLSITAASPNPTGAASVNYTVTFSEAVTGVDASDFTLITTGISGTTIGGLTGSGSTYTVTVNTGSGSGTLRLDVTDNDSITDSAGLKLGGIGAGNGNFTTGASYIINRTPTPPPTATLLAPQNNIGTNFIPTYTWNVTPGATWYYLWINGPDGKSVLNKWYRAIDVCSGGTCSAPSPKSLLNVGQYKWWIQTWNEAGYGLWSSPMIFTTSTPALPGQASLVSPSSAIGDTTPPYTWNRLSGATWYYLWVSNSAGAAVIQQWYDAAEVCGASTCSVTPAGVTLPAGSYTWRIQTWNPAGYGPWSPGLSFSLALPPAATLVSPSGTIGSPMPAYTWNKVNGATWYYLWIDAPGSSGYIKQWYEASAVCGASTCSVTPNVNLGSGSYTWWVQTWNDLGYGSWSGSMSFNIP